MAISAISVTGQGRPVAHQLWRAGEEVGRGVDPRAAGRSSSHNVMCWSHASWLPALLGGRWSLLTTFYGQRCQGSDLLVATQPEEPEKNSGLDLLIPACRLFSPCLQSLTLGNHSVESNASAGQRAWGALDLTPRSAGIGTLQARNGGNHFVVVSERKAGLGGTGSVLQRSRGRRDTGGTQEGPHAGKLGGVEQSPPCGCAP